MEDAGQVADIPVAAGSVRWERPTARSFWNALADPEREALAAAGVEEVFRAGSVLCRAGEDTSQVLIIDSGWVKVSVRDGATEKILAVRGQGDVVGERAALTTQVRSATVTSLDEVSAMVIPAERFAEFLRSHPRAAEVLERQVTERREEDRARLFPGEPSGAERRLAWLLLDLAQRRGGYQHTAAAMFTLPMSQQELADWTGTSADAIGRFLRSWRDRGIIARGERSRRLTVIDLDGLAAVCDVAPPAIRADQVPNGSQGAAAELAQWQRDWQEPLNCSIVFTDVAGFSDPVRTDSDRDVVRILGVSHPDTLIARQSVARMLGLQLRYAEAERLSREVLADRHRLLGDDHPDTLTSRATLAWLAARQGRRGEAEELYRQVIADRSRVLGSSHPDTAAVRDEFARLSAG